MTRYYFTFGFLTLAAISSAQTTLASDTFETYSIGSALRTDGSWDPNSSANYLISNEQAFAGTKSVKVIGQNNLDLAWINLVAGSPDVNIGYDPTKPIVTTSVKMYLLSGSTLADSLGLNLYDGSTRIGGLRIDGDGTVEARNASAWVVQPGTATLNAWNTLDIVATYTSATTGTISYRLNGSALSTSYSMGSGFGVANSPLYQFGNASGYFDNYSVVQSAPVPEPATLAALAIGGLMMSRKRRKQA